MRLQHIYSVKVSQQRYRSHRSVSSSSNSDRESSSDNGDEDEDHSSIANIITRNTDSNVEQGFSIIHQRFINNPTSINISSHPPTTAKSSTKNNANNDDSKSLSWLTVINLKEK